MSVWSFSLRAACLACLLTASAWASAQADEVGGWEFQVTPYAWMSGLNGEVGSIPGLPPVDVDMSFGDILDDLEFAGMVFASARKGPWVVLLDATYARTSTTEGLGGVIFDSVRIKSETATLAAAVGRRVIATPGASLDAYAGARAWWLDNKFELRTVAGGQSNRTEDASWVDPLIGVAARFDPAQDWTVFGALEVGGFGVGADFEWSVLTGATYRFNDTVGMTLGWRHLDVDYDEDGVVYDVSQSGPVLGATFRF